MRVEMDPEAFNLDGCTEFQPTNPIDANLIRGIHKDSSGKLWSIYLSEADEQDEEVTELWRGEAESILVFTGLFSGVVATFLTMSYSDLFLNSNDAILTHISRQLVDISNGVPSRSYVGEPFTPSASAIRVNVIWFLSLVLSIASALNATLFQQWSRRYLEITRHRVAPHKRARTRAFMFDGIASFKMSRAVKAMPILLHLSMFLFFAGLIDFLWDANSTVGHWTLGCISVLAFAYLALTVLPNLYLNCPYSTPVSELSWRLSQYLLLIILHSVKGLQGLLDGYLLSGQSKWRQAVNKLITARQKWLKDGLQTSIMDGAKDASSDMDKGALAWTLTVLDDDREFEDFVARVPGFFDSNSIKNAPSVILPLMDDQSSLSDEFPVLGSRISDLLKTCVPGTSLLTEQMRRNRLRVCTRTLWYCAEEYNKPRSTSPLPSYVRTIFANPEMTRQFQSEEDVTARLIGRSFSSLVAQKLARDIGSRNDQRLRVNDAELSCIAAILGKTSAEVVTLLGQPSGISLANIISLTSSERNTLVNEGVPSEVQDIFLRTLNILFADAPLNAELPPDLVAVLQETSALGQRLRVLDPRVDHGMDRLWQILEVSMVQDEPEVTVLEVPEHEPGLGSQANTSHISLRSREGSMERDSAERNSLLGNVTHPAF